MSQDDQQELFKSDFGWFHFFRTMIRSGTWGKMSLAAKAIYPVIKSYSAAENGAAFPSIDTLGTQAGLSKNSVTKALKELVELELLTAKLIPGKPSVYRVNELFDVQPPSGSIEPVSFPYVPLQVGTAVEQLKAFLATGAKGNLIQFNITTGEQTINNTVDGGAMLQNILEELERLGKLVDNSKN